MTLVRSEVSVTHTAWLPTGGQAVAASAVESGGRPQRPPLLQAAVL